MTFRKLFHIIFILLPFFNCLQAQELINSETQIDTLGWSNFNEHSSVKPFLPSFQKDSTLSKNKEIKIHAIPDLNIGNRTAYRLGLGSYIQGTFNNKLSFRLVGIGGWTDSINQISSKSYSIHKPSNSISGYYDLRGRLSYTPNTIFNFQTGLDHHFIGEGNRSLLLSDYGVPAPFAQVRARFWRVDYTLLYQFLHEQKGNQWHNKYVATHYLSYNIIKNLNVGIFETVVFQPQDTLLNRGFDAEYLNPIVFFRPQEYALGSADNILMGLQASYQILNHKLYGQLILDEFDLNEIRAKSKWWASKYGFQLGIKGHFKNKAKNQTWWYRIESNAIRPYTYSHVSKYINYGNQNDVLAHPMGANFMEILGEVKWEYKKWMLHAFLNYSLQGYDKEGYSYGGNIYQPYVNRPFEYGHYMGQGESFNEMHGFVRINYQIQKATHMQVFVENHLRYRTNWNEPVYQIVAGVRSALWNNYRNY
jgi:hypothetical protein